MTIRYKTWALALASILFAAPAMADNGEGPYLWVTVGAGIARNGCQSPWVTTTLPAAGSTAACKEKSPVARAGFGYQYTPMWGL